ncbi:MAG: acyl-CoA dehydrogenase family protein [Deltaproteobacteria bacterium]|nr:acyl-CoA dehydrogenase family protein [Deltaproteobacteria bacterium]
MQSHGLDHETLQMLLATLESFGKRRLPLEVRLALDEKSEFPEQLVRELLGPEIGLHLLFIPEEHGGLGGGAYDVYRVSELMARMDLGVATAFLAIFLGSDPIIVGATPEQKAKWMRRIAEEGLIVAYGVTEPLAGSEVSAIRTRAERIEENGVVSAYKLNGAKQFITNGGHAQLLSILASAPEGPSFFLVEGGTPGLKAGRHEDKHGIRSSDTSPLTLEDVIVPAENLIGGVEGKGLLHAQSVFGFTRLMVAAFGLGCGVAAMLRAIRYSRERIQAGSPLCEKQGYTHKLLVPPVVRLEAARAYIAQTARRLDSGEPELQTEGAIAKLVATEAGNAAADAAVQAHGGYGYCREYEVEKIRRDVRITTIYEGTSEIMQWTIARDRWRAHLQGKGEEYRKLAASLDGLHREAPDVGADTAAIAVRAVLETVERARVGRLTRHQHVLFRLGEIMARAEVAANFCRHAAGRGREDYAPFFAPTAAKPMARICAREAALDIVGEAVRWLRGTDSVGDADLADLARSLGVERAQAAAKGLVADMDAVARALVEQDAQRP